ncbi:MAG: sortase [Clostridia bacterium]|nr:sortase [Clostridia bacterium]
MKFGNACIAGHNYKNDTFFSNISKLENGDIVEIHDNNNNTIKYEIYEVTRANQNDISCLNQDTDNSRIITLITCDSINDNYRIIVKAKEINSKEE